MKVEDIRQYFVDELESENFVSDKTGSKTIELIGASFLADESSIFGIPNDQYIAAEIDWYESQSLNINDINYGDKPPAAWQYSADKHGNINSNYGYLVWSDSNLNQFNNVVKELSEKPDTRRATMVYTRPSIWNDYNVGGKTDFICTNAVTYYIRDNKLHCVVQMRSNDVCYGYRNDYAWQKYVLTKLVDELSDHVDSIGDIHWQVQNLHIYSRHFYLVDHAGKASINNISKSEYDKLYPNSEFI